jgi:glycosyltransferase involved in cell wall biosynthesis
VIDGLRIPAAQPLRSGRIVHVSADFPDDMEPGKTRAIESLVRLTDDRLDNEVISLNRNGSFGGFLRRWLSRPLHPRLGIVAHDPRNGVAPVSYDAPPRGLFHATMLELLGEWLADRLAAGPRPALLVGHKLTVEGIVVRHAARLLGIPFAVSIQGDTDTKILSARPDLRALLADCFHEAAVVFPFAPWTLERVETALGRRRGATIVIPCPVANDALIAPRPGGDGLVSAFHLQSHRRKNLDNMALASDRLADTFPRARLAIVGGGSPADRAACARVAANHPAIALEGPQPLAGIPARLNRASGFVLASRRESFGLVFIEALFAGLPIAYPAGWAVDGFFDGLPFAIAVDSRSPESIAEGMIRLLRDEHGLKRSLAEWQSGPGPARFRRATIAENFAAGLAQAAGMIGQDR